MIRKDHDWELFDCLFSRKKRNIINLNLGQVFKILVKNRMHVISCFLFVKKYQLMLRVPLNNKKLCQHLIKWCWACFSSLLEKKIGISLQNYAQFYMKKFLLIKLRLWWIFLNYKTFICVVESSWLEFTKKDMFMMEEDSLWTRRFCPVIVKFKDSWFRCSWSNLARDMASPRFMNGRTCRGTWKTTPYVSNWLKTQILQRKNLLKDQLQNAIEDLSILFFS